MDVIGVTPRGRVRHFRLAVDAISVATPGASFAGNELEPTITLTE
jgi:hypothetical protein